MVLELRLQSQRTFDLPVNFQQISKHSLTIRVKKNSPLGARNQTDILTPELSGRVISNIHNGVIIDKYNPNALRDPIQHWNQARYLERCRTGRIGKRHPDRQMLKVVLHFRGAENLQLLLTATGVLGAQCF